MSDHDAFRLVSRKAAAYFLWIVAAWILACAPAKAQVYVGGSIGRTWQSGLGDQPHDYSGCNTLDHQRSASGSLFAGYRYKYAGLEAGAGDLFHSRFGADCPGSSGTQDVRASYRYARMNGYIPMWGGIDLVPFVGRAFTKHTNYEQYVAPAANPPTATNYTTGRTSSNLFGIGAERRFGQWLARVEIQHIDHVAEDYWTARGFSNSTNTVLFGVGRYF